MEKTISTDRLILASFGGFDFQLDIFTARITTDDLGVEFELHALLL